MAFLIQMNTFITMVSIRGINRGFGKRRKRSKIILLGAKNVIVSFCLLTTTLSFTYIEIHGVYHHMLESVVDVSASFPKVLKGRTM